MENATNQTGFNTWGFVELMGHQRVAGRLSEECIAGINMLRVDIPTQAADEFRTVYHSGSSIYAIHPTGETEARQLATRMQIARPSYAYTFEQQRLGSSEPDRSNDLSTDDDIPL